MTEGDSLSLAEAVREATAVLAAAGVPTRASTPNSSPSTCSASGSAGCAR